MITEILEFKVKDGIDNDELLKQVDYIVKNFHQKQSGHVDAELVKTDETGCWKIIFHYKTKEDIRKVGQKVHKSEVIQEFSKIIAPDSVKVSILEQFGYWKND